MRVTAVYLYKRKKRKETGTPIKKTVFGYSDRHTYWVVVVSQQESVTCVAAIFTRLKNRRRGYFSNH
jgi:hypothetical protein